MYDADHLDSLDHDALVVLVLELQGELDSAYDEIQDLINELADEDL